MHIDAFILGFAAARAKIHKCAYICMYERMQRSVIECIETLKMFFFSLREIMKYDIDESKKVEF